MGSVKKIEYKGHVIVIGYDDSPINPFENQDFPSSLTLYLSGRHQDNYLIQGDFEPVFEPEHEFEEWDERYFDQSYFSGVYDDDYFCKKACKDIQVCVNCREKADCRFLRDWRWGNLDYWEERKTIFDQERDYVILPIYKYEHSGVAYNTTGFSCPWDSGCAGYIAIRKDDEAQDPEAYLESIVHLLHCWASGNVYYWAIYSKMDPNEEIIESCGGFYCEYGDSEWDYMIAEAKGSVNSIYNELWQTRRQEIIEFNQVA